MASPCPQCGAEFAPRRPSQTYCSVPCARQKNGGQNRKAEVWWVDAKGYIQGRVWVAGHQRRVKQHRWYMERHLGRELRADEHVHHKDGNKQNNTLANLELLSATEHARLSNSERTYARGKKIKLSDEERARRSAWMRSVHASRRARAALARADGAGQ